MLIGCTSIPQQPICASHKPRSEDGWERYYFSTPKDSDAILNALNEKQRQNFQGKMHTWYKKKDEYLLYIPPFDSTGCFEEAILVKKIDNIWRVVSDNNCLCVG